MKQEPIDQNTISTYNALKKIRGNFNSICPITRRIENKKKNPKIKHKGREFDYE